MGDFYRHYKTTMFIRKKSRKNKRGGTTFDFVVVSSHRTPQGPRSKVLCHLGSIEARFIEHPEYGRCHHVYLWESRRYRDGTSKQGARDKITAVLAAHVVEQDRERERASLIAGLAKHVAEPTQEDIGQDPAASIAAKINALVGH